MGGKLGIIGGSGLYALDSLTDVEWRDVDTAFGRPSDALLFGKLGQTELVFLPRHGRGHRFTPSEVPYRANIAALKAAGCTHVLSLSACGSFKEALSPGTFVLVDQFADRTRGRVKTFFGEGIVAHISLADPICGSLGARVAAAAKELDIPFISGGTYLAMEGPQFSTRAESRAYVAAGFDVIGMTNMPEAALAREAELCYATVAMVTDYDSWRPAEEGANVADIMQVMHGNTANARKLVEAIAADWPSTPETCPQGCDHALQHAIMTDPALWPAPTVEKLRVVAGRVLK